MLQYLIQEIPLKPIMTVEISALLIMLREIPN